MFRSLTDNNLPINRNSSWWKKKTQMEKYLVISLTISLIIIVSLLISLHVSRSLLKKNTNQDPKFEAWKVFNNDTTLEEKCDFNRNCQKCDVCTTPGCIQAAAHVLASIDSDIDPCDDFYRFACGKYIKNSIIADDKTAITTFTALQDQLQQRLRTVLSETSGDSEIAPITNVKKYYKACIDKKTIEKNGLQMLQDIVKKTSGWPVLEGEKWRDGDFDWKEVMYKFSKLGLETLAFLEIGVGTDFKNSSVRCIQIDQPEFGLNRELLVKGKDTKLVQAYFNYMVDIAEEFGCNRTKAEMELREAFNFELDLAKLSMSKEERRNITKLYNVISIGELQEKFSGFPWLEFINKVLPLNNPVGNDESVILVSPGYIKSLIGVIQQTPKRVQANYALWRLIKSEIPYLTATIRQKQLKFKTVMTGITEQQTRWKECVDEVSSSLPILASALYVRKYFSEDAKKKALEMVGYIKDSFKHILETVDWMDEVTKKRALEKAGAITDHIGYPDELLDDKKLEEQYKTLEINSDQYLQSHLNIEIHYNTFMASRLREPVNKSDWIDHGNMAQVNAFYHPLENSITFPAGILQGLFFNKDRPRYMNYAAIGSIIGHELTHGFDDTGRQFDEDGNFIDWWAPKTKESFLQKAKCVIQQYGNYTVTATNEKLNGVITLGENIADNGGIKEAYVAYNTWVTSHGAELRLPGLDYTPNQLFWISGAMNWCANYRPEYLSVLIATDSHSASEFRVLGPFSNSESFSNDFYCPLNSQMNPTHKCSVW